MGAKCAVRDPRFAFLLFLVLYTTGVNSHERPEDGKGEFEAAFQGKCGKGSPCDQLCYELHDGMYECDCKPGFELHEDGYSCYEGNATLDATGSQGGDQDVDADVLYQKDTELDVHQTGVNFTNVSEDPFSSDEELQSTTQGPSLEQKLTEVAGGWPKATAPLATEAPCSLECGPRGGCVVQEPNRVPTCLCPLGKGGARCEKDVEIQSPRFSGSSWLAFPALRGAYKHVQLALELRPEAYDGIFFLTGERDDMAGDFMALLLHQGFVEFRFDCGSGIGVVRSDETVLLNQWNHVTLYRHRWDAWLQLNGGRHVQGRSKGLFSRITFREPLFIGGAGNTTGLLDKLPISTGLKGCLRNLEVNDHPYKFAAEPHGEASKGYGIEECTADRCSHVPCQHGGKCLTNGGAASCLCPLGFAGDLCEVRVDLRVPFFNGSAHLRYRGLGDAALTWLDLEVVFKPAAPDGLLMYNAQRGDGLGDHIALYLRDGFVEFSLNLGDAAARVRSSDPLSMGAWHVVKVSRTGRLVVLHVGGQQAIEATSAGAFTQLLLPQNLFLGGVPSFAAISPQIRTRNAFVGCVQKLTVNNQSMAILAEALGGANVDNCPHPCVARPCGEDGECVPQMEYFFCKCKQTNANKECERVPNRFNGRDSFLRFTDKRTWRAFTSNRVDINIRFKVTSYNGLLLWFSNAANLFSLGIENGVLMLRFTDKSEEIVVVHNSTVVNDNLWHRVRAVRRGSSGLLVVDDRPSVTAQRVDTPRGRPVSNGLYLGGTPPRGGALHWPSGVRGCIADLILNGDRLQLTAPTAQAHNIGHCDV